MDLFYYIFAPSICMREKPSRESRVVSEALYGEQVVLMDQCAHWQLIQTPDGYQGWIDQPEALLIRNTLYVSNFKTGRKAAHVYAVKDTEWGAIKTLPFASPIQVLGQEDERWFKMCLLDGQECYVQRGDVLPPFSLKHKQELIPFAKQFLDLPYTWGGRSSFGFDCSGFVQMLYEHINIQLPRDSCLQVKDSRFRDVPFEKLEAGDLIFFGKSALQIGHVGMAINPSEFIHTSPLEQMPYLRVSSLKAAPWNGDLNGHAPYRTCRQLVDF